MRQLDTVFKILAAFLRPVLPGHFDRQVHSLNLILQRGGSTGDIVQLQTLQQPPSVPGDRLCLALKTFCDAALDSLCILLLPSTPHSLKVPRATPYSSQVPRAICLFSPLDFPGAILPTRTHFPILYCTSGPSSVCGVSSFQLPLCSLPMCPSCCFQL